MRQGRLPTLAIAMTALLAGCGGEHRPRAPATAASRPAAPRTASASQPLLSVWRNFEETGIPDEITIGRDGAVRYRYLLHTQTSIKAQTARLAPREVRRLGRLARAVDLRREDASGVKPVRSGYRYVIRRDGLVGTAADGHLRGPVRPLVRAVGRLMDRLQQRR